MFGLNPAEIFVFGIIVVLLFGTKRLPELGTGLGKAISNFRQSYKEGTAIDVTPKKPDELGRTEAEKASEGPKPQS